MLAWSGRRAEPSVGKDSMLTVSWARLVSIEGFEILALISLCLQNMETGWWCLNQVLLTMNAYNLHQVHKFVRIGILKLYYDI